MHIISLPSGGGHGSGPRPNARSGGRRLLARLAAVAIVAATVPAGLLAMTGTAHAATATCDVTGISPASGPTAGGNSATITGDGFTDSGDCGAPVTDVFIFDLTGDLVADITSFTSVTSTAITLTMPAESAGTYHAFVDTFNTEYPGFATYTYGVSAPAVTGVSPSSGPVGGGTSVSIAGSGFTGATAVDFGTAAASSFTVNSDTSITATAPAASSAGTVDVTVTSQSGTSSTSSADQYSYDYAFTGFLSPVDDPPTLNQVHAGQAIPMQWSLGGDFGLGVIASGYPTATQVSCSTGAPVNSGTLTDTSGGSGLQYDSGTGTYTYVWKTLKAWSGTCQQFTLTLNDGTSHIAVFQFQ